MSDKKSIIMRYQDYRFIYLMGHIHYYIGSAPDVSFPCTVYLATQDGIAAEFVCSGLSSASIFVGENVRPKPITALFVKNDSYVKYERPRPLLDFGIVCQSDDFCIVVEKRKELTI